MALGILHLYYILWFVSCPQEMEKTGMFFFWITMAHFCDMKLRYPQSWEERNLHIRLREDWLTVNHLSADQVFWRPLETKDGKWHHRFRLATISTTFYKTSRSFSPKLCHNAKSTECSQIGRESIQKEIGLNPEGSFQIKIPYQYSKLIKSCN